MSDVWVSFNEIKNDPRITESMGMAERDLPFVINIIGKLMAAYVLRSENASGLQIGAVVMPLENFRTILSGEENTFEIRKSFLPSLSIVLKSLKMAEAAKWN